MAGFHRAIEFRFASAPIAYARLDTSRPSPSAVLTSLETLQVQAVASEEVLLTQVVGNPIVSGAGSTASPFLVVRRGRRMVDNCFFLRHDDVSSACGVKNELLSARPCARNAGSRVWKKGNSWRSSRGAVRPLKKAMMITMRVKVGRQHSTS